MNSPPSEGPQVVIPTYPETHPHHEPYGQAYAHPNLSPVNNHYYTSPVESQHHPQTSPPPKGDTGSHSQSAIDTQDKPRRIPIWLLLLLAFFAAAAIGLAAALGVEMNHDPKVVEAKPVDITNGCAENGTNFEDTYLTKFYKPVKYDKFCNKDAPNEPLFSLFAGTFHNCIEACNNWNNYPLSIRQSSSSNKTSSVECGGGLGGG
ncbi:hypothetical protein CC79DRAFT_1373601 [Sarocladium strictum]